jgi:outer membrane lipoprotein LolB
LHFPGFNLIWVLFALVLTSCATQTTQPQQIPVSSSVQQQHLAKISHITLFSLHGRLGVVTQKQGFSGSIEWQHQTDGDEIDVFSPLGGKVAHIQKNVDGVILTDAKGNSIKAEDAESLTNMTLGFQLPLAGLSDWALGRPTASKVVAMNWDEQGRLTTLKQDGWDIQYEHYVLVDTIFLPKKIVLKSEQLNLKLLIEQWKKAE